jgi:hypothetical protein
VNKIFFEHHMEKVKIPLHATHSLSMFGYQLKDANTSRRRKALDNAVAYWGSTYVIRKLNVLAIYRKNQYITQGRRARADMHYVQKTAQKPVQKTAQKSFGTPRKPQSRTPRSASQK